MGKAANKAFDAKVVTGKMTKEKIVTCRDSWVRQIAKTLELQTLARDVGYTFATPEVADEAGEEVDV